MKRIGVVDTTFARVDMGGVVVETLLGLHDHGTRFEVIRRTVPGFKDLAVEAKVLLEHEHVDAAVCCGWVGGADIDTQCAHEASLGLMAAQLMTNRHVLEVFIHERESPDPLELLHICTERCLKHALNAHALLFEPEQLVAGSGQGLRQGGPDVGPLS